MPLPKQVLMCVTVYVQLCTWESACYYLLPVTECGPIHPCTNGTLLCNLNIKIRKNIIGI